MQHYTQAIITILALVNPAICAQMFASATAGQTKSQQYKDAMKSVLTIATVLLIAAFAGTSVLHAFGISLPAFSCAGGGILIWIGVQMIISAQKTQLPTTEQAATHKTTGLVLFAASRRHHYRRYYRRGIAPSITYSVHCGHWCNRGNAGAFIRVIGICCFI